MANTIELANKFLPIIDDIYKNSSFTDILNTTAINDFNGVNEIKVLKVNTTGLGDYSRVNGYPKGDITASWETLKLTKERGKEISIDRMDNEETIGMTFGAVTSNFMKEWVVPELDAYRFSKYASTSNILTTDEAKLDKDTIINAIDSAICELDSNDVPYENRVIFVNTDLKSALNQALVRNWGSDTNINTVIDSYNNIPVIYVPKNRFYTAIDLKDGSSEWGYSKNGSAKNINFMIIHKSAVVQVQKFVLPKIFSPDENQTKDDWLFQFRLYHDAFIYDNKVKGVFLHKSTE